MRKRMMLEVVKRARIRRLSRHDAKPSRNGSRNTERWKRKGKRCGSL